MAGPTINSIFNRIDTNHDGKLNQSEVLAMVKAAGVGGGLFGGIVQSETASQIMSQLDTNKDGFITENELTAKMVTMFAGGTVPPAGQIPQNALGWFDTNDTNHDGQLTHNEMEAPIEAVLEKQGQPLPSVEADAMADIGIYLLGGTKGGTITRAEMQSLAQDIDTRLHPVPAPSPAPTPNT